MVGFLQGGTCDIVTVSRAAPPAGCGDLKRLNSPASRRSSLVLPSHTSWLDRWMDRARPEDPGDPPGSSTCPEQLQGGPLHPLHLDFPEAAEKTSASCSSSGTSHLIGVETKS